MKLLTCFFFCVLTAHAQLAVTVSLPKVVGQKAVVQLKMKNNLADKVESARAVCFLLDDQGRMVGHATRWVIGGTEPRSGTKGRPPLAPKHETTFNFVVNSPQPWTTTNLTAKFSFSRVVLAGGKLADVKQTVSISPAAKGKP